MSSRVRVLSLHNRAVNLEQGEGSILTLAHPGLGNGPDTVLVEGPWPLELQAGEEGEIREGLLRIGPLHLALPPRWRPPEPPPGVPAVTLPVQEAASALPEEGGLLPALRAALGLPAVFTGPFAAAAIRGLTHLAEGRWTEAVRRLTGLGPGLTPGGDDIVAGYVTALHRSHQASKAVALGEALLALPPGATTPVSLHLLRWAARGVAGEHHLAWLDGLLTGNPATHDRFRLLLTHGATSGAEWAGGALLALYHLQREENARCDCTISPFQRG
ncbi:MAG: DUF2877 domain-containing protein [Bacillota bacterium]